MPDTCQYCLLEICFMCNQPKSDEVCCCEGNYGRISIFASTPVRIEREKGFRGRPPLDPSAMKSPLTAGRARAEDLAPIPENYTCEWAFLDRAGGGIFPIIGCAGNNAYHRHHGPDKNTLNNTININLHRVCHDCHNRWHELNDPCYGERPKGALPYLPLPEHGDVAEHDRLTRADPKDIIQNERWWKLPKLGRTDYRIWNHPAA